MAKENRKVPTGDAAKPASSTSLEGGFSTALAPAQASGSLYQQIGHSVALAARNAVFAQQQANLLHQAVTTIGVSLLYSLNAGRGRRSRRKKSRSSFKSSPSNVISIQTDAPTIEPSQSA